MEPEGSLPCSREPVTGPYPEPDDPSPHPHTLFNIHPICAYVSQILFRSHFSILLLHFLSRSKNAPQHTILKLSSIHVLPLG